MSTSFFKTPNRPGAIILILAIVQLLCVTWLLKLESLSAINSILFFISGAGISLLLLQIPAATFSKPVVINKQLPIKLLIIVLLLPVSYELARNILDATPLEKEYADMLPVMKTMCTRFIDGQWRQVYEPIPEIWDGVQPSYLPAMWLPFTSSIIFHFDMRWVTVGGIWLSVSLCVLPGAWKKNLLQFLFAIGLLGLLYWLHFDTTNNVIRLTEEGVVFFYYSLLVTALLYGNPWLVGIAAALCLLSRYALIGWLPFASLYLLSAKQYSYFLKTFATIAIVVLLLVVLPFGWKPLLYHLQFPSAYITQAAKVWTENPEFFNNSPGMAKLFGPERVQLLHYILLAGSFIIPLLFFFFARKKKIASSIVLLAGLQLCITFFYSFLDVSYLYLYYSPVFASLVIAGYVLRLTPANHQAVSKMV